MTHQNYFDWMQLALDEILPAERRAELHAHLAECPACTERWEALNRVHTLFAAEPLVVPRSGFTGRFKARVRQQRSQPRTVWGFITLGVSAAGTSVFAMVVLAFSFWPLAQLVGQPAAANAVFNNVTVASRLASTLAGALWVVVKALGQVVLFSPAAWAIALVGLVAAGVWVFLLRRLSVQGIAR
jgi:anti-sigma factor RsiW